jgi:carbon storage regulator
MLVLTRKLNEAVIIDGNISVTVVAIRGNQVRLGFTAPQSLGIYRAELCEPTTAAKNKPERSAPATEVKHAIN